MFHITAPAKINLALDIKYRRSDGYHEVDMVMQSIMLADDIWLADAVQDSLICNQSSLPVDNQNIALKAVNLVREYTKIKRGLAIRIEKKIPIAAGMAGGSSDAAAVLLGLNQFWELGLSLGELMKLGLKLGADVPFCLLKGTYRAQGIGEKLSKVRSILCRPLFLITPDVHLATVNVYQGFSSNPPNCRPDLEKVVAALEKNDLHALTSYWGNTLENSARRQCPALQQLYVILDKWKVSHFLMSGSGPTVFLLDPSPVMVAQLQKEIPEGWFTCWTEMLMG